MQDMSPVEYKHFLQERARTGKLATVRADGRPHVAPIWFALDGDTIVFTTWHETVKAHNIRRDGRVCLCVDEETPPFAFVIIEGTAELRDDMAELAYWARRIAGRYMGSDQAEAYGQRNSVAGELVVRVTPTKIVAKKDVAGW
jgi:PPOX class probable F420-dependent enzyme